MRYAGAVAATAVAFGLTWVLYPQVERTLFLFFFAAVAVAAWFGGFGPGLVAAVFSIAAVDYVFLAPAGAFSPTSTSDMLALGVFGAVSGVVSSLSASLRAAKRRSDEATDRAVGMATELAGQAAELAERVEATQFQLDAARRLATSLELDETLRALTALAVPALADYCVVYLADDAGRLRQAAAAHADPAKAPLLDELARRYRPDPANPHSVSAQVAASTRPVLRPAVTPGDAGPAGGDPELLRIYGALNPRSYMVVPLVARGQTLGTMTLAASASGRRFDERDLAVVETFAARAALAVRNAQLYAETEAARARAVEQAGLEAQLAQARLDALRAQLNPHFLFNALNTVAMLVRRGAGEEALEAVVGVSDLLRHLLAQRGAADVVLDDELAVVERYLAVERLRYRDRVRVRFAVDPAVAGARVPAMLLQPLVENAVRHGAGRGPGPGCITVAARRGPGGDTLTLEVRDEGPGFPAGFDPDAAAGIGLANTRERLRRLYGGRHRFTVANAPGGGAAVTIELPLG